MASWAVTAGWALSPGHCQEQGGSAEDARLKLHSDQTGYLSEDTVV